MSMQDPIADMLTRIRNAQATGKKEVEMPTSKQKVAIAQVLKDEGYVVDFRVSEKDKHKVLVIGLKYYDGRPVIAMIKRKSRPGLRVYVASDEIPRVDGFGIIIVSTSKGIMSGHAAKKIGLGGEIICLVS